MTIPTTGGSLLPARLAYTAALLFTLASGGTNLIYGWNKGGGDLAPSLIWAALSVAVSAVFALSWPALLRSIDHRRWSQAGMVLAAFILTGAYSVSAALGSAMGVRENASTEQQSSLDARKRHQDAYNKAQQELAAVKPSRPLSEMEALVDAARCRRRVIVTSAGRETICQKPAKLVGELGRARARAEWEAKAAKASEELSRMQAPKLANSDAVALATFLQAVGMDVSTERLNRLLVLLAVLVIECGGGLSLSVGMSLSSSQDTRTSARRTRQVDTPGAVTVLPSVSRPVIPSASMSNPSSAKLLSILRESGGMIATGQRDLARTLGCSRSWANVVLHELARSGLVRLSTGKQGTVVRLAA